MPDHGTAVPGCRPRSGGPMATQSDVERRPSSRLDAYFHISERGSTVEREIRGGLATFFTMAYIVVLNPLILGGAKDAGGQQLDLGQLTTSTALAAAVMTLLMGIWGRYPFAIAAGLGLNAVVAFQLASRMAWPDAMGLVVLEGLVITLLVVTGLRHAVMDAIPLALKQSISVGIGLFIAFIGLIDAGFVRRVPDAANTPVPVELGIGNRLVGWPTLVFCVGLLLTVVLVARRVRGAILVSIIATTIFAIIVNAIADVPPRVNEGGLLDRDGRLPGVGNVLLVDSLAAAAGGAASCSSNTTYIESAAGVGEGARTGLASVVTALLFVIALFLTPLVEVVPYEAASPVLVVVGFLLMVQVRDIPWGDMDLALPAFLTIVLMPFSFSITNGIGAGFITYVAIKAVRGRWREPSLLLWGIALAFLVYFAIDPIEQLLGIG